MAGLLDFLQTPQGIGLLSAVAGGMAGARKGTPINNIGRGLTTGVMGYNAALDNERQLANTAIADKYRTMQMQELEQKLAAQKAQQAWKAGLPGMMDKAQTKVTPFEADNPFGEDLGQLANVQQGDPQALQQYLMQPESPYAERLIEQQIMPSKPVVLGKTLVDPTSGKTIAVDETWKEETTANREQRIQELQMRLDDQRLNREQQMALRRELADQQAALRRDLAVQAAAARRDSIAQGNKPPSGYRYTPDGNLEQIPGGPADLKRQAQLEGGGTVDSVVASLRDSYNKLEESGGITSTNNRAGTNAGAWLGSTALGQTAGSMFGTSNQKERDVIAQQRPLLLQAIMKATGMSAKQMDSNAELKLYLATATDPTKSLQANRQALEMIEKLYGSGAGNASITGGNSPAPKAPAANAKPAATFDLPPNAKQYEGKTLRDTKSGKRFKSSNGKWVEVK